MVVGAGAVGAKKPKAKLPPAEIKVVPSSSRGRALVEVSSPIEGRRRVMIKRHKIVGVGAEVSNLIAKHEELFYHQAAQISSCRMNL